MLGTVGKGANVNMLEATGIESAQRGFMVRDRYGEDLANAQRSFAGVLGKAVDRAATVEDQAREAAQQLVAQTFVLPLLKELRASDRTAPPFAPTQGERQFRALMDAELAQRVVQAGRFGVVERVAHDLLKHGARAPGE